LDWQALSENMMIVKAGDNRVIGVKREFRSGAHMAQLSILDDDGNTLDSVTVSRTDVRYSTLSKLFDMARKKSLKIDAALEDVKKFLDSI
jgi:hypothetical protein